MQCSQCRHAFTVARKPKAQSAPAAQAEILQEDVIHAKMPLREKLARLKQQSAALAAQQAGQDADESLHTQKKPLAAAIFQASLKAGFFAYNARFPANIPPKIQNDFRHA